jgi:hypothetical protein
VNRPGDLFEDPHLAQSGGLIDIRLPDGRPARTPALPVSIDGERLGNHRDPPRLGEHTREVADGPRVARPRSRPWPRRSGRHEEEAGHRGAVRVGGLGGSKPDNGKEATMTITRRQVLATGAAALGAGLMPPPRAQGATATLAFGPATPVYALGPIAEAKGYFKAENLDFKLVVGNAGTHGRQALAAEQALFAHGDASHPLQLSTRGKKCKIIMATQMIASISNIVVRKDLYDAGITTVEKLADYKRPDGAKPIIAATAIGSGTWMYGTYVFESKKLGDRIKT